MCKRGLFNDLRQTVNFSDCRYSLQRLGLALTVSVIVLIMACLCVCGLYITGLPCFSIPSVNQAKSFLGIVGASGSGMNCITDDTGNIVIAIGAPGSIERCRAQYPRLIEKLNRLWSDSADCFGRSVDEAIELIRECGIRSELETNSILACSHYSNEKPGSVTALTMSVAQSNKDLFKAIYTQALTECVKDPKHQYAYSIEQVPSVAARMFEAMDKGTFSHDGPAFKLTAKRLGIKPTRTAITTFWKGI